jgi:L-aspartate oxidase
MPDIKTDFLVVGGGVAGLRAAIELAQEGRVLVVTKDVATESSTEYAQGGVAVAMSDEDEVGIHFEDTLKAGDGLCRDAAVKTLVEEGPERIRELIEWGAEFDRDGTKLSFTLEAAHSRKRVLHAGGDSTGRELARVLTQKVRSLPNIERLSFSTAIDLIIRDGVCCGALVLMNNERLYIYAGATVLTTGGAGQVFSRTTNPAVVTGDGIAMAYRAGAILEDMEFVQFHPTVLFAPSAPQFLLSEAMRGEGALLKNIRKEPFMKNYHTDAELAPRDVVSRAIMSEMVNTGASNVFLDLAHLNADFLKRRFPRIYATCLKYDINITRDLIPVSPAAHYIMGGVKTDLDGSTSIRGLYAAGETACTGVHGANRLASNSLLEGLVYGYRAGRAAARQDSDASSWKTGSVDLLPDFGAGTMNVGFDMDEARTAVRRVMWEKVGIIRCGVSLKEAEDILGTYSGILKTEFNERNGLELKNMLTVSLLITTAASERKDSVGGHYRSDFPEKSADRTRHIAMKKP